MEFYGFLHFTVNTFTDKEWGFGDEQPAVFFPTDFNADQIVRTALEGGMKGLILTCKHHDGFCLWPSKYTEHSVKHSPWKDGKGDVVREISDACRKYGLKFGVYLSPWDRNHPDYGRPEYIVYYRNQLRELLTNYGPIFEMWFDGANGGDGYYGGTRERREIDRLTYYRWEETLAIVRELQPKACMFSDAGPDIRWNGNEEGIAGDPCWQTLNPEKNVPGIADLKELNNGNRPGSHWLPAESDVSIRPGWFYHSTEDERVRSSENLVDLYFKSIGRGSSFNLNLPPDRRGQIHDTDRKSLLEFRRVLDETFAVDLAKKARVSANNTRGNSPAFKPANTIDGNPQTYWSTDDGVTTPELILAFDKPIRFNIVNLREYLPLGQRIDKFGLDSWQANGWQEFASGTSIGNRRLVRGAPVTTSKIRLRVIEAPVCPAISEIGLYLDLPDNLQKVIREIHEFQMIGKRKTEKPPVLRIPRIADKAAAGDPSKVDWDKATPISLWRTLNGSEIPERKIKGALAQDGKYLYVALEETLDPAKLSSTTNIWSGDDWELFFAAQRGKTPYRQIAISPEGNHFDYEWAKLMADGGNPMPWTNNAVIKSDTTGGRWQARVSFPLAELIPGGVKIGQPFYINVFRATPKPGEYLCWSPTFENGFHDVIRMAELTLE